MGSATVSDTGTDGAIDEMSLLGTAAADTFTMTQSTLSVAGKTFDYVGIENLRLAGLGGDDKFAVGDISARRLFLDGGDGSDTYQTFTSTLLGDVYLHDSGPAPTATGGDIDELDYPNTVQLSATTQSFTTGQRTVHFDDSIERTHTIDRSPFLTITGRDGSDTVTVNGNTATLVSQTAAGALSQVFDISFVTNLTINTLGGDDSVQVIALPALLTTLSIDAGTGNDTVFGPDVDTVWSITGDGEGTASVAATRPYTFSFQHVENLTGGVGADSFVFANASAALAGNIDGDDGANTLDYSALSSAVTVNLASGAASGLGGTIASIGTIIGSAAAGDTLIGADAANLWHLSGVDRGDINGEVAFASFENLTGGSEADRFDLDTLRRVSGMIAGGGGDDALDIAFTSSDDSVTADAAAVRWGASGRINYADIGTLTLDTQGGKDTITLNLSAAAPAALNINSGTEDDVITVNLGGASTAISIDGGAPAASDSVIVNGTSGADTIAVNGLTVTSGATVIALTAVENLTVAGGGGNDMLSAGGVSVTGALVLQGQGANDSITVNAPITAGSVTVDGGTGSNSLAVTTTDAAAIVTLGSTSVQVDGSTAIAYSGFATLTLTTGTTCCRPRVPPASAPAPATIR